MSGDVMSAWRDGAATTWRVEVDAERCVGSGVCAGTAPRFFRLDAGISQPVLELAGPDMLLLDAAFSCPVEAISIQEISTGVMLAPGD